MGRNYPRVASEGGRGRPMTKSWMTLTSRNTEPPKDAEDSSPGGGGRAESRTWRKDVRAFPEKGGNQLFQVPQGPPPLLNPHVLICPPQSTLLSSLAISPPDLQPQGWTQIGNAPCRTYSPEDGNISDVLFASVFLPRLMSLCSLFLTKEFRWLRTTNPI